MTKMGFPDDFPDLSEGSGVLRKSRFSRYDFSEFFRLISGPAFGVDNAWGPSRRCSSPWTGVKYTKPGLCPNSFRTVGRLPDRRRDDCQVLRDLCSVIFHLTSKAWRGCLLTTRFQGFKSGYDIQKFLRNGHLPLLMVSRTEVS
jgi:hypothetical protein